jgi:hypothetical protein
MEDYIQITKINDFLYSPLSIYLHSNYEGKNFNLYKEKSQLTGSKNHENIDEQKYSTKKNILTGTMVYSEEFCILGKIDIFDRDKKELVERKTKIKKIHRGYVLQLYAQYFCLLEMGEIIENLCLYSLTDNKKYKINLPNDNDKKELLEIINKIKNLKDIELLSMSKQKLAEDSIYGALS